MNLLSTCIQGRWLHSREEDADTYRCYRPAGWGLPLTRLPRHMLEFTSSNEVVSWVGGPDDARRAQVGRWTVEASEPLALQLTWQGGPEPAILKVLACTSDMLHLQVVSGSLE